MCYYVSSKMSGAEIYQLEHDYVLEWEEEEHEDYFVASGFAHPKLPVVTSDGIKFYDWGLIPPWVKDMATAKTLRIQTLNAIGDTIDTKPSYRGVVKAGKFCIVPVNGFFEWHHIGKEKYPHFIYPKESKLFYLAGIFDHWKNPGMPTETFDTFSIVTTAANERMEWIHNSKKRMPAILNLESAKAWLDNGIAFEQKKKLLVPSDPALMADHPISKLITSRKEKTNTEEVLKPFEYPELALG